MIPFFAFSAEVRRIIYTSNAIESVYSQVRKALNKRDYFPSDKAATELIYLALRSIESKWKNLPIHWHQAKPQFAIHFEDRFAVAK